MNSQENWIVHVDMDAFFAQVEKLENPSLRDRPVIVGGLGSRGVVSTACYQAREFGIESAMPMAEARERCPQAEVISPRTEQYKQISKKLFSLLQEFAPTVKSVSLDEAYLEATGVIHRHGTPKALVNDIKSAIEANLELTASIGMGTTKMIAKLASDYNKPDGKKIVRRENSEEFLKPLDIGDIPGFGPKTREEFRTLNIYTIGDLQNLSRKKLLNHFGSRGLIYRRKAFGKGQSTLKSQSESKSISHENTYEQNVKDKSELLNKLHELTRKVAKRLRSKSLEANTVFIKERRGDFTTVRRQRTVNNSIRSKESIWNIVKKLFSNEFNLDSRGIRLQGVGVKNLREQNVQEDLFQNDLENNKEKINDLMDEINDEMGKGSIFTARHLKKNK